MFTLPCEQRRKKIGGGSCSYVVKYICVFLTLNCLSPSSASIRFLLYAGGSHCNVFSCYLIKIVVVVVVVVVHIGVELKAANPCEPLKTINGSRSPAYWRVQIS